VREVRVRRRALAALILAASVAVPRGTTTAGVPLVDKTGVRYRWDLTTDQPNVKAGKVTFFPDPGSLRDALDPNNSKSPLQAIRDGVGAWEIGTTEIRFTEDTSRPASAANGLDRVNWIGWAQGGLDRLTLALTTVTRDGTTLTDMDVVLNDKDWKWDSFNSGRAGIADIQSLVAHEWGHAIGCDHVPLRTSTMYFATNTAMVSLRSLAPDDRALVGSIYPNASFQTTTGALTGHVDVTGTSNDRAVHVVAVSAVSGEPEASALSMPDGSWRIDGLPAGLYRVLAAPCVPLKGAMNDFWTSGQTSFLPTVLRDTAANPAAATGVVVAAGQVTNVAGMTVGPSTTPFEPNDSLAQSKPIEIGQALCARFESGLDEDWYAFTGAAGQKVSVNVLSWTLGAQADPAVRVTDDAGMPIALQDDVRSTALFGNQPAGEDLDVRVLGLALPESGQYHLRLRNQTSTPAGTGFYVLFLTFSSDAPSTALTTVTATPPRIDADGQSVSKIVVYPKRETGDYVGPGATVNVTHTGTGSVGPVTGFPDGSYTADVTAPAAPGTDRFSVSVSTAEGTATLLDAATITYLGAADDAKTTLDVSPRRIDAGVLAQSTVTIVPRDALGEPLGKARTVVLDYTGPNGADLVGLLDLQDGTYADTVKGTSERGTGVVTVSVDGTQLGLQAKLSFGFGLAEVLTDAQDDVAKYLAVPGIGARAQKALKKAQTVVAKALAELAAPGPKTELHAVAAAQTALLGVAQARTASRVQLANPGTERDLARSLRETAVAAIARAVVAKPADQKRVDAANADIVLGDSSFGANAFSKAAAAWKRAYGRVRPLLPQ
jgi:hypothetical protein